MKKIATYIGVMMLVSLVMAPVVSAAYTQDEANQIAMSANEVRVDLANFGNNFQVYSLLLQKITLDLNILRAQLSQGQISMQQAETKLNSISADVTNALTSKSNLDAALSGIVSRVNMIVANKIAYINN
jgi:polyisoprenoid-binding protein YceI